MHTAPSRCGLQLPLQLPQEAMARQGGITLLGPAAPCFFVFHVAFGLAFCSGYVLMG